MMKTQLIVMKLSISGRHHCTYNMQTEATNAVPKWTLQIRHFGKIFWKLKRKQLICLNCNQIYIPFVSRLFTPPIIQPNPIPIGVCVPTTRLLVRSRSRSTTRSRSRSRSISRSRSRSRSTSRSRFRSRSRSRSRSISRTRSIASIISFLSSEEDDNDPRFLELLFDI